ncbi:MAG: porin [Bdellovibrionales bacterium]|nr:porin [Bdellovibrionales bacterium]
MKNKPIPILTPVAIAVASITDAAYAAKPHGISLGGFIDAYIAYDVNNPSNLDRSFTTQPARHNEFNINLAYLEAKLEREKVHGRLALQAGTSVQSNYASEPTVGSVSGPNLSRHLQEAFVGYRLGDATWIDAGIMLSHIGVESFISKDNLLYTRSLVADFSPYYETGVRLSHSFNDQLSAQLLVLNGWQIISENNQNKALGTQLSYSFNPKLTLIYNTFFGRESSFRHFHDLILKFTPDEAWSFAAQADIGFQDEAPGGQNASWNGFSVMAKRSISQMFAITSRVERYTDPKQVLIASSYGHAFQSWGASLGLDANLDSNIWWRNEVRGYFSDQAIFPSDNGFKTTDGVIVSSISAAF